MVTVGNDRQDDDRTFISPAMFVDAPAA